MPAVAVVACYRQFIKDVAAAVETVDQLAVVGDPLAQVVLLKQRRLLDGRVCQL